MDFRKYILKFEKPEGDGVVYCTLEKCDLFHSMVIFWKDCRKRLENPISIVLSTFIECGNVFIFKKYCGNILEIKLPYGGKGSVFQ